jgi:hypothetical protein
VTPERVPEPGPGVCMTYSPSPSARGPRWRDPLPACAGGLLRGSQPPAGQGRVSPGVPGRTAVAHVQPCEDQKRQRSRRLCPVRDGTSVLVLHTPMRELPAQDRAVHLVFMITFNFANPLRVCPLSDRSDAGRVVIAARGTPQGGSRADNFRAWARWTGSRRHVTGRASGHGAGERSPGVDPGCATNPVGTGDACRATEPCETTYRALHGPCLVKCAARHRGVPDEQS